MHILAKSSFTWLLRSIDCNEIRVFTSKNITNSFSLEIHITSVFVFSLQKDYENILHSILHLANVLFPYFIIWIYLYSIRWIILNISKHNWRIQKKFRIKFFGLDIIKWRCILQMWFIVLSLCDHQNTFNPLNFFVTARIHSPQLFVPFLMHDVLNILRILNW